MALTPDQQRLLTEHLGIPATPQDAGTEESPPPVSPPAESPPAESPPAESPPAESPPAESPPEQSPPEESPPAESPPAESPPAESPPEQSPPEESPPAESPPEESPPEESPPEESPPEESPPEESPPEESPPEESPPEESPPEESPPEESPPEESPPEESPPEESPPEESPPEESPPEESPPEESPPEESPPEESPPEESPPGASPPPPAPSADTVKHNVDHGLDEYGSKGKNLAKLKGGATLNTRQGSLLDDALRKQLAAADHDLSDAELQALAQDAVGKIAKLAEVPLEDKIPGLNAGLAKSAKLKDNIVKLQQAGWTVKPNVAGKGSSCDRSTKTILIDPSQPLSVSLGNLAHETGHADFTPPAPPTIAESKDGMEYVRKTVESNFIDEGEAQMVACKAVLEMKAAGTTAKVPADGGEFMAIYAKFQGGKLSEDAARKEMAKQFGKLVTSTTGESYLVYYGKAAITTWNQAHPKPEDQLANSALSKLKLFP